MTGIDRAAPHREAAGMSSPVLRALWCAVLAAAAAFIPAERASADETRGETPGETEIVLECGRLFDVEERRVLTDQQVLVRGSVIAEIAPSVAASADARRVDLSDRACLPGLMDMHVHLHIESAKGVIDMLAVTQSSAYHALQGMRHAQTLLNSGFTTIRVPGDMDGNFAPIEIRNAINRGEYAGPRIIVAPIAISPLGGHGDLNSFAPDSGYVPKDNIADGADAVRREVRRQIKFGADWIKVMASGGVMSQHDDPEVAAYSAEEFAALVEEAHRHKKKIAAHAHGDAGIRAAVEAGVDSIEHGTMMTEPTARLMAKKGVYWVPTFYVQEWIVDTGKSMGITANSLAKGQLVIETHAKAAEHALEHGVNIVLGSDPIFPMRQAIKEFDAMARRIPDKWLVLQAGTITAAEMLGKDDMIGSLAVGKKADVVALKGDPLKDMTVMENVDFVMKDGVIVRAE